MRAVASALGAVLGLIIGTQSTTASHSAAGCAMEVLQEGHDRMQSGRLAQNMPAVQENIAAFKRQQAADEAATRVRSAVK